MKAAEAVEARRGGGNNCWIYENSEDSCFYFVSVDYDSITASTRKFQQSSGKFRRSVRCDVHAKIFRRREFFFDGTKIFEKLDRVVAIDSVQKSSKSELSLRFFGCLKISAFFGGKIQMAEKSRG